VRFGLDAPRLKDLCRSGRGFNQEHFQKGHTRI
jgi:hypothetical protein